LEIGSQKAVRISASQTGCALLPANYSFISVSGSHFCYSPTKPYGLMWPEGLGNLIKPNVLKGSPIRDLPFCIILPQIHVPILIKPNDGENKKVTS
jgi:hypothetical protein